MIRISQIKLPVEHNEAQLYQKVEKSLKIKKIVKKSIDARKKPDLSIVYSVDVWVDNEEKVFKRSGNKNAVCVKEKHYYTPVHGTKLLNHRPVIIGAGPAGLFCAYLLAKATARWCLSAAKRWRRESVMFWSSGKRAC
jgi:uncharacterized FAD-dependent dehydrogenase